MSRLVTFGCSLTYGYALPDCFDTANINQGPTPSKFAWPSLLADSLGLECKNMSWSGISNKHIWNKIINFEFIKNDTVIIMWTHVDRWTILKDKDKTIDIGHWRIDTMLESKLFYENFYSKYDLELMTSLFINHANCMLKSKNIKVNNLIASQQNKDLFKDIDHIKKYMVEEYINLNPKGLDGVHPGLEAHQKFAKDLLNYVN
jgi:hypothetical protein